MSLEWAGVKAWQFTGMDDHDEKGIQIANTKSDGVSVTIYIREGEPAGVVIHDGDDRILQSWGWVPAGAAL